MTNNFERHYLGPLIVLLFLLAGEIGVRYFDFPVLLAIPYAVLSLTAYRWSGLRSALFSAFLISLYPLSHLELYGSFGAAVAAIAAFLIAAPSGILKRALREEILETEYYRQKEIDTYNGNRAKAVEALDNLDKALKADEEVDIKKYVQIARIKLADTLTLINSWREMAKDKEEAISKLEQAKRDHEMKSYIEAIKKRTED